MRTIIINRDRIIDFLRGLVIADMIVIHLSDYFFRNISVVVESFDFAIEGFIFLAGFMVGSHYLSSFNKDAKITIMRLVLRAAKLIVIQYIMIFTITLPYYAFFQLDSADAIIRFCIESLLFKNQIPILHILPTFVPLLLAAPLIIFLLAKNQILILILLSLGTFLFAKYTPIIVWGQGQAIFPVALWQVYFVVGSIIGHLRGGKISGGRNAIFLSASIAFGVCCLFKFGSFFSPLHGIKAFWDIYPKKFPLNVYGLIFGGSLIFFLFATVLRFWPLIERREALVNFFVLLGRNSLAVFIIQAYFIYLLNAVTHLGVTLPVVYLLVVGILAATYKLTSVIDMKIRSNEFPITLKWLLI